MEQNEGIKQDTQYLYYRVAEDSTRWDRMTGIELKRRIKSLLSDGESFEKMVDVISCLRLAPIFYLRTKNKEECAVRKSKMTNINNMPLSLLHILRS